MGLIPFDPINQLISDHFKCQPKIDALVKD
jgi:hypothetical protein